MITKTLIKIWIGLFVILFIYIGIPIISLTMGYLHRKKNKRFAKVS